ncbi:FliM/FliN family flagellar motor C-terminal domain-containing protein [Marimonas sp. MJW-29]|uniref:FliM/FliN family flagellar motor C-terminal domain-containing protein n=1 Tax=Sulfitobacter sediminis TaxID=3234186 RepID=A0ABV3RHU0_9RHOB
MEVPDTSAHGDVASGGTIIHRKAKAGRAEHQSRAVSLAKALRLTLARVADEMLDMAMALIAIRTETVSGDDLADRLSDPGLLMLLDGPARARAGTILDPALVGALIQQQTMGKVLKDTGEGERTLTQTDAAICAPFLDALLARAAPLPEKPGDRKLIEGYAYGAWIEDARMLAMSLDLPSYELVDLSVDIAGGVRQGRILFCLPKPDHVDQVEQQGTAAPDNESLAPRVAPSDALVETIQNLNAELRISLARIRMPLKRLGALEVGSVLEIGNARFDDVRVQTITGQTVRRGTLGQVDGQRAVQVQHAPRAEAPFDRRAADRDALDTPELGEMGMPLSDRAPETAAEAPAPLPDLSDLQGDGDQADTAMPDMADLPDLDDLPDLPDMSDLPDLDMDLRQRNAG